MVNTNNRDNDHDALIITMEAVKAQADAYKEHINENKKDFESMRKSIQALERVIWISFGVVLTLQFFATVITTFSKFFVKT